METKADRPESYEDIVSLPRLVCSECERWAHDESLDENGQCICGKCRNSMHPLSEAERVYFRANDIRSRASVLQFGDEADELEATRLNHKAIRMWKEALELGLKEKIEVSCHFRLGRVLFESVGGDNLSKVSSFGLEQFKVLSDSLDHFEESIRLDAGMGAPHMRDAENLPYLLHLDTVWGAHSSWLLETRGPREAKEYLERKLGLISHLNTDIPTVLFDLGHCHSKLGNISEAENCFQRSAAAPDFEEELGADFWTCDLAKDMKEMASGNLAYIRTYGRTPDSERVSNEPSAPTIAREAVKIGGAVHLIWILPACALAAFVAYRVVQSFGEGPATGSQPKATAVIQHDKITNGRTKGEKVFEFIVPSGEWVKTSLLIRPNQEVHVHHFTSNERVSVRLGNHSDNRLQKAGTILPLYTSENCTRAKAPSAKVKYSCVEIQTPQPMSLFAEKSVRVAVAVKSR